MFILNGLSEWTYFFDRTCYKKHLRQIKLIKLTLSKSLLWEAWPTLWNRCGIGLAWSWSIGQENIMFTHFFYKLHQRNATHSCENWQRVHWLTSKDTQLSFHVSTMLFLLKCGLSCCSQTGWKSSALASCNVVFKQKSIFFRLKDMNLMNNLVQCSFRFQRWADQCPQSYFFPKC